MSAEILDVMLADIAFAAPVTVDDCAQVRDALRMAFPTARLEVHCHKNEEVVIRVDGLTRRIRVS